MRRLLLFHSVLRGPVLLSDGCNAEWSILGLTHVGGCIANNQEVSEVLVELCLQLGSRL